MFMSLSLIKYNLIFKLSNDHRTKIENALVDLIGLNKLFTGNPLKDSDVYQKINNRKKQTYNQLVEVEELAEVKQLPKLQHRDDFLYFKSSNNYSHPIKLHIPLKDYKRDGFLIANLLRDLESIQDLKLVNPLIAEFLNGNERIKEEAPITIYFSPQNNWHDILQIIVKIEQRLAEARAFGATFDTGEKTADSDVKVSTHCSITMDRGDDKVYINASEEGGAYKRQQLIKNSVDVQQIFFLYQNYQIIHDYHKKRLSERESLSACLPFFNHLSKGAKLNASEHLMEAMKKFADTPTRETFEEIRNDLSVHVRSLENGRLGQCYRGWIASCEQHLIHHHAVSSQGQQHH